METVTFATIAIVRLLEGGLAAYLGWRWKRWAVTLWGVLTIILCIPVVALAFGHEFPRATTLSISCVHAIAGACVVAALMSSRGVVERLRQVLQAAALPQPSRGWRA